uniref:Uncharacterized protein n=1 Tax=Arundo donax TaxID=35708 RepID=A0A0A9A1J2_ARUDO
MTVSCFLEEATLDQ